MMRPKTGATAIALWLGMSATVAQAATPPCLTKQEVQTVVTAVLPDVLRGIGKTCATTLPAGATLRGGLSPLVNRFEPAAKTAWPGAIQVFAKAGGVGTGDLKGIDPKLIQPMVAPMISSMFTDKIKPAECPKIDRLVTLIAPLPPENLAELFAMLAELGAANDKKSEFKICPTETSGTPLASPPRTHQ